MRRGATYADEKEWKRESEEGNGVDCVIVVDAR